MQKETNIATLLEKNKSASSLPSSPLAQSPLKRKSSYVQKLQKIKWNKVLEKLQDHLIKQSKHPLRDKNEKKQYFSNHFQEWDQNFDNLLLQKKVNAQDLTKENSSSMKDQEPQYKDNQYQALIRQPYDQKHFKQDMIDRDAVQELSFVNVVKEAKTKNQKDDYSDYDSNSILPDQSMKEEILIREHNLLIEKLFRNKSATDTFRKAEAYTKDKEVYLKETIDQMLFFDGNVKKLLILQKIFEFGTEKLILKVHVKENNFKTAIEIGNPNHRLHPDYISYELKGSTLYYIKHFQCCVECPAKDKSQICALDLKSGESTIVKTIYHEKKMISMIFLKNHETDYVLEREDGTTENPEEAQTEKHEKFLRDKLFVTIKQSDISSHKNAITFEVS